MQDKFIWRAIDLIVQEIGPSQGTSPWFRDEWQKLVDEMKKKTDNEEV